MSDPSLSSDDLVPDAEPGEDTLSGLAESAPGRSDAPGGSRVSSRWGWYFAGFFLVMILGGVGLGMWYGTKILQAEIARRNAWENFSDQWQAPELDADGLEPFGEELFPVAVGPFRRETTDVGNFPFPGIELEGEHAAYADGDKRVDLFVFRVSNDERAEVLLELRERIFGEQQNDGGPRFSRRAFREVGRQAEFAVSPPDLCGNLWYAGGYFV
ncbi:MAG: hypothetical protein AAGJ97_10115, partial [Planctomycetota bacterium]